MSHNLRGLRESTHDEERSQSSEKMLQECMHVSYQLRRNPADNSGTGKFDRFSNSAQTGPLSPCGSESYLANTGSDTNKE